MVNGLPGSLRRFLTLRRMANTIMKRSTIFMNIRNEIKAYIVREGFTMSELAEKLADALGYDLVWQKRR